MGEAKRREYDSSRSRCTGLETDGVVLTTINNKGST